MDNLDSQTIVFNWIKIFNACSYSLTTLSTIHWPEKSRQWIETQVSFNMTLNYKTLKYLFITILFYISNPTALFKPYWGHAADSCLSILHVLNLKCHCFSYIYINQISYPPSQNKIYASTGQSYFSSLSSNSKVMPYTLVPSAVRSWSSVSCFRVSVLYSFQDITEECPTLKVLPKPIPTLKVGTAFGISADASCLFNLSFFLSSFIYFFLYLFIWSCSCLCEKCGWEAVGFDRQHQKD